MNSLRPEPRVNKLGHVVTKHVRDDMPVSSSLTGIPAPAIASPAEEAARREWTRIIGVLDAATMNEQKFISVDRLVKLGAQTASRFAELLEATSRDVDKKILSKVVLRYRTDSYIKARTNSLYAFRDLIAKDLFKFSDMNAAVDGLHPTTLMEAIDYSKPSLYMIARPKMELIAGLMQLVPYPRSASKLIEIGEGEVILHAGLQRVAINHPDRIQDILHFIVDRKLGEKDMGALNTLLNNAPSSVLMDGAL